MEKLKTYFKISLLLFLSIINITVVYNIFFSDKERRFKIAELTQGTYFSDYFFKILNKQYPQYSDAFWERSVAYNKRGQFQEGFYFLNKAVSLNAVEHLGYRAWLKYEYLRDYDGAIKDFKTLDSLTPKFVDYPWGINIYQLLGNSYAAKGDYENALITYNKYLNLTPSDQYTGDFFVFYGKALEHKGFFNDALESYSNSLKLDSLRSDHHYYKAVLLFKLKRYSEAEKYFTTSLALYRKGYLYLDSYNELYLQINENNILYYKDSINHLLKDIPEYNSNKN